MSIARNSLVEIGPPPVQPDRALLQIATYPAHDDLLAVLQQLGRSGYTIALDDFDGRDDLETLLGLCSIVKVEVASRSDADLSQILVEPKLHGALLVATGVAAHHAFERCRALGFSSFQGDFFAKPRLITHRGVGTGGSRRSVLWAS
jgi:EAL and modified HD-GYP domain-containing signal transduction protein